MKVINEPCERCRGAKKVLAPVGTSTTTAAWAVGRQLADCPVCDDGHGPTGLVLVPGRPPLRQFVVRALRRVGH